MKFKIKLTYYVTCVLLFALLGSAYSASAQYNDSTFYHVSFAPTGSINKANGNTAYLLNNNLKFNIRKKVISFNFTNTWIYGRQNVGLTNNDYSSFVDFNVYKGPEHFYYWGLLNYNTSYSLKINNQLLAGGGLAYNIIDKPNAYLNLSDGILYDASDLMIDGNRSVYHTYRNSLRLAMKFNINNLVTFESSTFLQNSLDRRYDYIIRSASSLQFKLRSWISVSSSLNYNRQNRTGGENLLFTYGLNFEKYF
ncbi:DUF481 domain-containing protein [Mucilaginibacter auburnensis]|uniref:Uncharacterized protein DUF481 n=1 Tax=Mucilaginibacter auburnensis TaxID=1457233 RepID=A0A2H9VVV2_9SPHI|nr:DUF481 domain-containing protein [Mucilaginibacter auburnensis]PJJ84948.1 uncharacterized protein DUF481 [Mucilaginibacter auburnensis]